MGKKDLVTIKAIQLSISSGIETSTNTWDGSYVRNTRAAAKRAYTEAGTSNPREQVSLMEVHDCFSITELVTMEDLFISKDGGGVRDVLDGFYDRDGGGLPNRWRPETTLATRLGPRACAWPMRSINNCSGGGTAPARVALDRRHSQPRRRSLPGHRRRLDPRSQLSGAAAVEGAAPKRSRQVGAGMSAERRPH